MCRFMQAYVGYRRKELDCEEAGLMLGMPERQFRRLRDRYVEEGAVGVVDRRLGKASARVHEYPDGALAIFHGPRRLADYKPDGSLITPNREPKTSQQAA